MNTKEVEDFIQAEVKSIHDSDDLLGCRMLGFRILETNSRPLDRLGSRNQLELAIPEGQSDSASKEQIRELVEAHALQSNQRILASATTKDVTMRVWNPGTVMQTVRQSSLPPVAVDYSISSNGSRIRGCEAVLRIRGIGTKHLLVCDGSATGEYVVNTKHNVKVIAGSIHVTLPVDIFKVAGTGSLYWRIEHNVPLLLAACQPEGT